MLPHAVSRAARLPVDTVSPVFVSAAASQQVLAFPDAIAALRRAYSVAHGPKVSPPRVIARGDGTWLRALASCPPQSQYMGAKIFGFGRSRTVSYLIALFEQSTGALAALVDGNLITAYRTAATSAVAFDRLAGPDVRTLAVLGSGLEAQMHARAFATVRPLRTMRVFSPTPENRLAFANTIGGELGIEITAVDTAAKALDGAEAVVAAARSYDESPILQGQYLQPGMTVISIGSTMPEQREVDVDVVRACDLIVCDVLDEVLEETGDMLAAKAAGVSFQDKSISLNEMMTGAASERLASARLPMFKSTGAAIQDVVVAELVVEKAINAGLAKTSGLDFLMKA